MTTRVIRVLGVVVLCAAVGGATTIQAAPNFYVRITGAVQGVIEGEEILPARVGTITGHEYHHLVQRPAGSPAEQHQDVIFTKKVDGASVNLWKALETDEILTVVFEFWRTNQQTGNEEKWYTVELSSARLTAIEPFTSQTLDPSFSLFPDFERVRLTYGQMKVTHVIKNEFATVVP